MDGIKDRSLREALCDLGLQKIGLPKVWRSESDGFWLRAVVLVRKRNGDMSYMSAERRHDLLIRYKKDYGRMSPIVGLVLVHPYLYFDRERFMPDVALAKRRVILRSEMDVFGVNGDVDAMSEDEVNENLLRYGIELQLSNRSLDVVDDAKKGDIDGVVEEKDSVLVDDGKGGIGFNFTGRDDSIFDDDDNPEKEVDEVVQETYHEGDLTPSDPNDIDVNDPKYKALTTAEREQLKKTKWAHGNGAIKDAMENGTIARNENGEIELIQTLEVAGERKNPHGRPRKGTKKGDNDAAVRKRIKEMKQEPPVLDVTTADELVQYINKTYDKKFITAASTLRFVAKKGLSFPNLRIGG